MDDRVKFAIIAIAVLAMVAYLSFKPGGPGKHPGPVEKITFGVDFSVISAPVWIAENRGYFQEEGLL